VNFEPCHNLYLWRK